MSDNEDEQVGHPPGVNAGTAEQPLIGQPQIVQPSIRLVANFQVTPLKKFSFKPEEWPKWIQRFERFRGEGSRGIGNPGGRGSKTLAIRRGVWIFSGITHSPNYKSIHYFAIVAPYHEKSIHFLHSLIKTRFTLGEFFSQYFEWKLYVGDRR